MNCTNAHSIYVRQRFIFLQLPVEDVDDGFIVDDSDDEDVDEGGERASAIAGMRAARSASDGSKFISHLKK